MDRCLPDGRHQPEDVTGSTTRAAASPSTAAPEDEYFATDGICTHEQFPLADGFVMDDIIECPSTTAASTTRPARQGAPACIDLKTYPVKVEDGTVFIRIE